MKILRELRMKWLSYNLKRLRKKAIVMREIANHYEDLANIAGKEMYRARLGKNMASTYIFNK